MCQLHDIFLLTYRCPDFTAFIYLLTGESVSENLSVQLPTDILNNRALADDAPNLGADYVSNNADYVGIRISDGDVLAIDDITYFPWDIDGNGLVTPTDSIFVINRLGQSVNSENALADLDGNGLITPTDAIAAINRLGYSINSNVFEWASFLFEHDGLRLLLVS